MAGCDDTTTFVCELLEQATDNGQLARGLDLVLGGPIRVLLIIVVAVAIHSVLARLVRRAVERYEVEIHRRVARGRELGTRGGTARAETRRLQRLHAIGGAARSGLGIVIGVTALLLSIAQFVDLRPVLAGAGLAGVVIGFGAQQLIADLLAGFSMLAEDQYGVGDWIDIDGKVGEVEHVGLRTTSFRDLDGVVWHVPNGQVAKVGNLTQRWARALLEIPLPLDADVGHARRVVGEVATGLTEDPEWADLVIGPPEIWGITEWSDQGLRLRLVVPTRPLRNWEVNRQMRERLKAAFDREGIRMPVPIREVAGTPQRAPVRTSDADDPPPRPGRSAEAAACGPLAAETARLPPIETEDQADRRPVRPDR